MQFVDRMDAVDFDRSLLAAVERRVPLVREPYAQIAADLGAAEDHVLARLAALRGPGGLVREISALFDAAALGYDQALVAMVVPPEKLDAAGRTAAAHPGVSHAYGREGEYDLWLTLAVSPGSRLGLDRAAERLAAACGAACHLVLPALKRYKLDVRFAGGAAASEEAPPADAPRGGPPKLTGRQRRAVSALQADLPNRPDPFAPLAGAAGLDADDLLVAAADFLAAGWMRRYAAVLRHRRMGAAANVLVAWRVDAARADAAGAAAAAIEEVSHCYLRPARPGWPYTLYTMVHGRSRDDCRHTVSRLAAALPASGAPSRPTDQPTGGPTDQSSPALLWTLSEYAKRRIRLFCPAEAEWEAQHAAEA